MYTLIIFLTLNWLTSTPDPTIPPKYQTSSVIFSFATDVPPGKNSKMLHSTHTMDRGSRLIPRHLAKPPEHILTLVLQAARSTGNDWFELRIYSGLVKYPNHPFCCTCPDALGGWCSSLAFISSTPPYLSLWAISLLLICNSQFHYGLFADHMKHNFHWTFLQLLTT